jgi:protein ImuB
MTLSHARPLLTGFRLHSELARPERQAAALHALALWCLRIAPIAAPDPPDGLLLDITGCHHLYPSEPRLLARTCRSLARLGITCRGSIAPTGASAWACARFAPPNRRVIAANDLLPTLSTLPVASLNLDPPTLARLHQLALDRVEHLLNIPRPDLARRFGTPLLHRLDMALGREPEHIRGVQPAPPPSVEHSLAGPTTRIEDITLLTSKLILVLCNRLLALSRGILALELGFTRSDLPQLLLQFRLSLPSADHRHVWSLIASRLERIHMGFGIEAICITATKTGRRRHAQLTSALLGAGPDTVQAAAAEAELIDTLSNRLSPERVLRLHPVPSHLPERSWTSLPAIERHTSPALPPTTVSPRPNTLLHPPQEIHAVALSPDGPLLRIRWLDTDRLVITTRGPERIAPEWWRNATNRATRDYYTITLDNGHVLWVCRELTAGRWFAHGLWA